MALTLGTTGMDSKTKAEVQAAFKAANAETGNLWTLVEGDEADYVVIDMDSLYGPMSWLRLHAAGRKVIGLTSVDRNQTDHRLPRPISADDFTVLLSEIAVDAPVEAARVLFEAVHNRWSRLPADRRPLLVTYGLSLGAHGSQAVFSDVAGIRDRTGGAMFVGSPNGSPLWRSLQAARDAGSPAWQPVLDDGREVRWMSQPGDASRIGIRTPRSRATSAACG